MDRGYVPWVDKHKPPHGFGSHCPSVPADFSQQLLEKAVADPKKPASNRLYAVHGDWCFVAMQTRAGEYHGYPILGKDVPPRVLKLLQERGDLTQQHRERLRVQAELPREDPQG